MNPHSPKLFVGGEPRLNQSSLRNKFNTKTPVFGWLANLMEIFLDTATSTWVLDSPSEVLRHLGVYLLMSELGRLASNVDPGRIETLLINMLMFLSSSESHTSLRNWG